MGVGELSSMLEQVRKVVASCPAIEKEWLVNSKACHIVFVFVFVVVFFLYLPAVEMSTGRVVTLSLILYLYLYLYFCQLSRSRRGGRVGCK